MTRNLTTSYHLVNINNNVTTFSESKSKMTLTEIFKEQFREAKEAKAKKAARNAFAGNCFPDFEKERKKINR